jgi:hypothetical protein
MLGGIDVLYIRPERRLEQYYRQLHGPFAATVGSHRFEHAHHVDSAQRSRTPKPDAGNEVVLHDELIHHTPVNAILAGTIVPFAFLLLVLINPSKPVHMLWFDYPAHVNALYALVSFATSGIYLAFFLTVLGALFARRKGWRPGGVFTLHGWGLPVTAGAALYLLLMLLNIVWPSSLSSGRAVFNYGWVTLLVMALIAGAGAGYKAVARPA